MRFVPSFLNKRYFGLNRLDKKLATYINYRDGFFVELGANDGLSQSNTRHFELHKGWRGVLVEPYLPNFEKLKAVRSSRTSKFNAACVSFDYKDGFVDLVYSNLMTAAVGLESDVDDAGQHALSGARHLAGVDKVHSFRATARPLNDLLIEAAAPKEIDLLSLDVEGSEIEVLKGIDHSQFRFKFIVVECRNLFQMDSFLQSVGYQRFVQLSDHDFLFKSVKIQ